MVNEWFYLKKDPDAPQISDGGNFNRKNYPYFIDEKVFEKIEDSAAYYTGKIIESDFLFEPTFLIHDRLQKLFEFLEPEIKFKGVQLYSAENPKKFATPLYWLPFLKVSEVLSEKIEVVQGKAKKLILSKKLLAEEEFLEKRILHCKLPAKDIWLINLDAAECLLRREPLGITLEKVCIE
jgi:hypothetical protein